MGGQGCKEADILGEVSLRLLHTGKQELGVCSGEENIKMREKKCENKRDEEHGDVLKKKRGWLEWNVEENQRF